MRSSKRALAAVSLAALITHAAAEHYPGTVGAYIAAPATIKTDIIVLRLAPEIRVLADQVRTSLKQNSEWLQSYVSELQPGQVAPYHQNFGISEPEYQTLLKGSREFFLVPAGTATLTTVFRDDETLHISGLPGEPPFNDVIYEPVSDSILCSYGTLTKSVETTGKLGTDNDTAWTGRLWKIERKEANNTANIGFVLGQYNDGSKNILIHEVTGQINDQPVAYHYMLLWDTPDQQGRLK